MNHSIIALLHLTGLTLTVKEPIIQRPNSDANGGLRVDWGVCGFWEFQKQALFDVCILNADAPSYLTTPLRSLFDKARDRRKSKIQRQLK